MDIMEILQQEQLPLGRILLYYQGNDIWRAYGFSAYFVAKYFPYSESFVENISSEMVIWVTEVSFFENNLQPFINADKRRAEISVRQFAHNIDGEDILQWGLTLKPRSGENVESKRENV